MNILIDIGHPAHVHLFKNLIWQMKKKGHKVVVTAKDDKAITDLLKAYNIKFINLGRKGSGLKGKMLKQSLFDIKVLKNLYKHNIDVALGTSISISHACLLHKSKAYVFNEDDVSSAPYFAKAAYPFAYKIITPKSLNENHGKKHLAIESLHELAYLHPNHFKPRISVLKEVGVRKGEKYFILRFSALKAHHDKGKQGISAETKIKLVSLLSRYGKVLITSEGELENRLKKYQVKMRPEKMHDLLAFAHIFVGDSQTMTLEAAVLGVPAIRVNDFVGKCPAIEELEHKYSLSYGFKPKDEEKMLKKVKELLNDKKLKEKWQEKRQRLLKDKEDMAKWMVRMIEESARL